MTTFTTQAQYEEPFNSLEWKIARFAEAVAESKRYTDPQFLPTADKRADVIRFGHLLAAEVRSMADDDTDAFEAVLAKADPIRDAAAQAERAYQAGIEAARTAGLTIRDLARRLAETANTCLEQGERLSPTTLRAEVLADLLEVRLATEPLDDLIALREYRAVIALARKVSGPPDKAAAYDQADLVERARSAADGVERTLDQRLEQILGKLGVDELVGAHTFSSASFAHLNLSVSLGLI